MRDIPDPPRSDPPAFIQQDGPLSEDAAALIFAQANKGKYAFCHGRGTWFEYDGSIWRALDEPRVFHKLRELVRTLTDMAPSPAQYRKSSFVAGAEKFAKGDPIFSKNAATWDTNQWLLGTPGDTVDLKTGHHRPGMSQDYITRAAAVSPAEWADCPLWLEFLRTSTDGNEELVRFLQQMCGYALTGVTIEHALFFIYGPGGNGKSVFLNVLTGILGDYAETAAMATFETSKGSQIPADLAMLNGARLVASSETEEGKPWAESRLKQITGGDRITARFMRENFFTFKPQFKLIVVGNHKPVLKVVDDAMKRRFNIIPFTVTPENPDSGLEEKLRPEWPAILRWMIDGCLDWQVNKLVRPEIVLEATNEYFDDQNVFAQWMEESCDVDKGNRYLSAPASVLYKSWQTYAKTAGEEPGAMKSFAQSLQREGFKHARTKLGVYYEFIRLKQTENSENN